MVDEGFVGGPLDTNKLELYCRHCWVDIVDGKMNEDTENGRRKEKTMKKHSEEKIEKTVNKDTKNKIYYLLF